MKRRLNIQEKMSKFHRIKRPLPLCRSYQVRGHLAAQIDPIGLNNMDKKKAREMIIRWVMMMMMMMMMMMTMMMMMSGQ